MSACTIWGVAARERDAAAYYTRSGRLSGAEAFDTLIEELPENPIAVTIGHDGASLGELVFGEISQAGQLNVVAVLDSDGVLDIDTPIYFSPELLVLGAGVRTRSRSIADLAALTGMALTTAPAGLGLTPISARAGDVRSTVDRGAWPISWRTADPLLGRALDGLGRAPRVERLERQADQALGHGWIGPDGERRPAGQLHHSVPRHGSILSVR